MPRQDGTGPAGNGPQTGRGLGNCKPGKTAGNQGLGKGKGRCCPGGVGRCQQQGKP